MSTFIVTLRGPASQRVYVEASNPTEARDKALRGEISGPDSEVEWIDKPNRVSRGGVKKLDEPATAVSES